MVALAVVAAVAIGVGVGIWHTRRISFSRSRWDLIINIRCHSLTPPVHRLPIHRFPTHQRRVNLPNTSTTQNILNETSLAAAILVNGDRKLYFQDDSGLIRYAVRTASTNQWDTSPHLNISSSGASAKYHTPLAVTANNGLQGSEQVIVPTSNIHSLFAR